MPIDLPHDDHVHAAVHKISLTAFKSTKASRNCRDCCGGGIFPQHVDTFTGTAKHAARQAAHTATTHAKAAQAAATSTSSASKAAASSANTASKAAAKPQQQQQQAAKSSAAGASDTSKAAAKVSARSASGFLCSYMLINLFETAAEIKYLFKYVQFSCSSFQSFSMNFVYLSIRRRTWRRS